MATVNSVIKSASEILQDLSFTTWTQTQLMEWINEAVLSVVLLRPDAYVVTANVSLAAGVDQQIPADGLRLISVSRNVADANATTGKAIRGPVAREIKDSFDPSWASADEADEVDEYLFDDRTPRRFEVSPPIKAGKFVRIRYAGRPPVITDYGTENIPLPDAYVPPILEWVLYRAFARDSLETPNAQRAQIHLQNFYSLLGVKPTGDLVTSPKMRNYQKETPQPLGPING